ncbi:hypothetical protein SLNSH_07455 [Alsobacter soli]|uniref:DUF155 domain-containing protein n=1 Tax=Alsobacter soli TaxID=2109933 RepID=A0A2T1HVX0_9HYPH|nr:RMD1 family protein [Alsobacter soli]PSC05803.1 hypothetical protein SLNSH_07455 [Alsobacter soli]
MSDRKHVLHAPTTSRLTARALLLGHRIDLSGLERDDMISSTPLAFHAGPRGRVALYRFGVAVFVGLSPVEEDDVIRSLAGRIVGDREPGQDETAVMEVGSSEDRIPPGGPFNLIDLSNDRFLCLADALAKTVALGRDEREVNGVLELIEPFAATVARTGRPPWKRRAMLKLVGQALLVQHRVAGRIAVEEKPDVLWDRPDLERLYARLEDEYELKERSRMLQRKLDLVVETVRALTDILDTDRSTRLEVTIAVLILVELAVAVYQVFTSIQGH